MEFPEGTSQPGKAVRPPGWLERLTGRHREPGARAPRRGERAPVQRVAVVTDSAAAVPHEWCAAHSEALRVVAMPVMIDGQIYTEGLDDVETELALALAMGRRVQTSRPAPGLFLRSYRELAAAGASEIVSIHLSAALSGTVDAARLAAAESPVPVRVVDTSTVGLAQGFAVMDAVAAAAAGATGEQVAALAGRARENTILFAVPSLEQLRKGGRIGAAASVLGTWLAVKPLLTVAGGQISVAEKVRTLPRALARLVTLGREAAAAAPGGARIAVQYFGNEDDAQELVHELAGASVAPVLCEALPAVLAAHTGAGVLAVAVAPVPTALLPASPLGGPLPGGPAAARPSRGPSPRESSSRERVQEAPEADPAENAPATEPTRTPNALPGAMPDAMPGAGPGGTPATRQD